MGRTWPWLSRLLVVLGAVPLVWFASRALSAELPRLMTNDPCFTWGGDALPPMEPPCGERVGGTSETKAAAIRRLTVIQGGMLASAALALVGVFRGRRGLSIAAFVVILILSLPLLLGGLGLITLGSAACFLPACFPMANEKGRLKTSRP